MKNFRLKAPLYAQMELTYACNLACSHCYNEERFSNDNGLVQLKLVKRERTQADRFVEIAEELVRNEVFSVSLTGGEVFSVRDRLFSSIEALARNRVDVTINSNATLITEDDARRLKDSGVIGVMTSLISYDSKIHDKVTNQEGSHEKTLRGIERLLNAGIYVAANMVVSKHNLDQVLETGKFAHSLGVGSFSTAQAVPSNNGGQMHLDHALSSEEVLQYLEDLNHVRNQTGMHVKLTNPLPYCRVWESHPHLRYLVESASCTAGRSIIQIDPQGNVKPCPMVSTGYGNILAEGLKPAWDKLSEWNEDSYVPETCQPCDLVNLCKGACRAEAQRMAGDLNSKHPYSVKPIKLERKEVHNENLYSGQKINTARGLRFREEADNIYVLYATGDRYLFARESDLKIISAINQNNGIIVNDAILANNQMIELLSDGLKSGILMKAA
ncbi:radical SAM protein [Candidatus Woesearchaeota archaeon]|nr:radical SAM protein [Candidatus Woesearchaeota archaeon]